MNTAVIKLIHGECLEEMSKLQGNSIDTIITDPPYGTTACKWDSVIPFASMWLELNRLIKKNGAIVLFGSEPFSSALRMSNIKNYKYDWVWKKNTASNIATLKYQPQKTHEIISVFNRHKYYPIMENRSDGGKVRAKYKMQGGSHGHIGISKIPPKKYDDNFVNPRSIQFFKSVPNATGKLHPTQKPVALIEYIIKTYTNEGETVLDFTMGSGTTGVACKNLNRNFIGIEKDDKYFNIAQERINNA
jgi:site-specific DNA-methyltransferase (adenine-specific)